MWGRKKFKHPLDRELFWWSERDPFRVRDLLNGGALILGRAGSGKTSSSGRTLMQSIVDNPKSGGLILAAKPEDAGDIERIFARARRLDDLVVFDAENLWRFNFLDYVGKGEARNVVNVMMMIAETLNRGERGSGEDGDYWKAQCERLLETAVIALQSAEERVTPVNLHKFIMTAATNSRQIAEPSWQAQYHGKVLEKGHEASKSPRQAHDHEMAEDFWLLEFPGMADRTRSSILTYATQILHVFNTGLCKEMVAGETNITPDYVLRGGWVLVNFPVSSYGAAGAFITTGWKYLTQMAVLKRKWDSNDPWCVIWADEFSQLCNSWDAHYICQARSHGGSLCALLQSAASIYAAMKGESGRHQADALLANFSHWIVHSCDPVTAKAAVAKLGRRKEILYSGSSSPHQDTTIWDMMYGRQHVSASFSEHYEQVLQDQEFMVGRTGGPENGCLADAIVIRSGETFADGKSYKRVTFSQR